MVKRVEEKGIKMGQKNKEFAYFNLGFYHSHPFDYIDIYNIGDVRCLQLYLAAFGAPWKGCIQLRKDAPTLSREEVWIKQGKALEYIKSWKDDVRSDRVSGPDNQRLNVGLNRIRGFGQHEIILQVLHPDHCR